MSIPNLSPTEVLDERISDILLKRESDPRQSAFKEAGWIAIKAVLRAGLDGNVRCAVAAEEIKPLLAIILPEKPKPKTESQPI